MLDALTQIVTMAWEMLWASWWALVLGFTIAGAVESFVRHEALSRVLGGSGPKEIGLATALGAASSSCSFGAVATAKSLFKKGASPAASLGAFQFASTNLVIELGLVMWILLGWQFVVANVAAGLLLIVLSAILLRHAVPAAWFDEARAHTKRHDGVRDPVCGMEVDPDDESTPREQTDDGETVYFCSKNCRDRWRDRRADESQGGAASGWRRLGTARGWRAAAQGAMGEWSMLWKDIALGYVIAAVIATLVPRSWWASLFEIGGDGTFLNVLAGATLGVTVGVVTFVCSVGNVPFAAVLWRNGIPFGGVMSFIFADLIVPTIVDAYRRYYGWRIALTLFAVIFVCAVVSGIAVHYAAHAVGLVPPEGVAGGTAPEGYTIWLNAIFTLVFAVELAVVLRGSSGDAGDAGAEGARA